MNYLEMIKPAFFCLIILLFTNLDKVKWVVLSFPIIILSYFSGGERLVFILYFCFVYLSFRESKQVSVVNWALALYFSYKGVDFIFNIFTYGDGFKFVDVV